MTLEIFLSTTLRKYVPAYDPVKGLEMEVPQGTTVNDLCNRMNIPAKDVKIIMVDGKRQEPDHPLNGDERVYLFPPIGGG